MKNTLTIFVLIIMFSVNAIAQSSEQNKYWFYRYRLRHKFLKAGIQAYPCIDPNSNNISSGFSIPAGAITYEEDRLNWGDGTAELGRYIGILATEWKLLNNAKVATDSTEQELYYAMKTFQITLPWN